jgi:hypothetical protein
MLLALAVALSVLWALGVALRTDSLGAIVLPGPLGAPRVGGEPSRAYGIRGIAPCRR